MPIAAAVIPAVVGAGTAVYSASQQKKATNKALAAQDAAAERQLADQKEARDLITRLQTPYVNTGYTALDQLATEFGLGSGSGRNAQPAYMNPTQPHPANPSSGQATRVSEPGLAPNGAAPTAAPQPASAPASGGTMPDWQAYLEANPDVKAWAAGGGGDPNIPIEQQSLEQRAAYQYSNTGQGEGRSLPTTQAPASQGPQAPTAPAIPGLPAEGTYEIPTYARPDQPVYNDTLTAPNAADYFGEDKFRADPGYDFRVKEAARGANALYGARGLLKSDAAAKGVMDRVYGLADQSYNNWFGQQMQRLQTDQNQYNTNRNFGYNVFQNDRQNLNSNFNSDRGYGTDLALNNRNYGTDLAISNRNFAADRQDTRTNNLFRLTSLGTGAAASVGGANSNYAANAGNIYGNQANARSDAAFSNAGANASMAGALAGIGTSLANNVFSRPNPGISGPAVSAAPTPMTYNQVVQPAKLYSGVSF